MKYIKANVVLPNHLLEELQEYIQGGYIYVPSKSKDRKKWGELSGAKKEIELRNVEIKKEYELGKTILELSEKYYLSIHSINKIIYSK